MRSAEGVLSVRPSSAEAPLGTAAGLAVGSLIGLLGGPAGKAGGSADGWTGAPGITGVTLAF